MPAHSKFTPERKKQIIENFRKGLSIATDNNDPDDNHRCRWKQNRRVNTSRRFSRALRRYDFIVSLKIEMFSKARKKSLFSLCSLLDSLFLVFAQCHNRWEIGGFYCGGHTERDTNRY